LQVSTDLAEWIGPMGICQAHASHVGDKLAWEAEDPSYEEERNNGRYVMKSYIVFV